MIPETSELSIVMLGDFNPAIFHPSWLRLKNLIADKELETARTEITTPHVSKFSLDWLEIEVTNKRCQFKTTDGTAFELLRDLVVNTFKILRETPINAFGINKISDFQVSSEQYEKAGNILAPFENWNEILHNPKLLRIEMIQENREDGENGSRRIRVLPSVLVKPNGIRIDVNSHFEVSRYSNIDEKLKVLIENWETELRIADENVTEVLKKIEVVQ